MAEKDEKTDEKEPQANSKKLFGIFLVTFACVFMGIFLIVQLLTPSIDVEIGDEATDDENSSVKQMIDDRLKWIQFEDNTSGTPTAKEGEQPTQEEVEYTADKSASSKEDLSKTNVDLEKHFQLQKDEEPIRVPAKSIAPPTPINMPKTNTTYQMSKVYIGEFATIEQAIAAQNRVMEAQANFTPFIKNANGKFILQAGSFTSVQKAQELVQQLNSYGFSARIVQE